MDSREASDDKAREIKKITDYLSSQGLGMDNIMSYLRALNTVVAGNLGIDRLSEITTKDDALGIIQIDTPNAERLINLVEKRYPELKRIRQKDSR